MRNCTEAGNELQDVKHYKKKFYQRKPFRTRSGGTLQ